MLNLQQPSEDSFTDSRGDGSSLTSTILRVSSLKPAPHRLLCVEGTAGPSFGSSASAPATNLNSEISSSVGGSAVRPGVDVRSGVDAEQRGDAEASGGGCEAPLVNQANGVAPPAVHHSAPLTALLTNGHRQRALQARLDDGASSGVLPPTIRHSSPPVRRGDGTRRGVVVSEGAAEVMRRVKARMQQGQLQASQPLLVPPGNTHSALEFGLTAIQRANVMARLASGGSSSAASVASLHVHCAYAEFRAASFSNPSSGGGGSALSRGGGSAPAGRGGSASAAAGSAPAAGMYPLDGTSPRRLSAALSALPPAAPGQPAAAVSSRLRDLRGSAAGTALDRSPAGSWDGHVTPRVASLPPQRSSVRSSDGNSDDNSRRRKSVSFLGDNTPTPPAWPRSHG